jgi:hypothetical protein
VRVITEDELKAAIANERRNDRRAAQAFVRACESGDVDQFRDAVQLIHALCVGLAGGFDRQHRRLLKAAATAASRCSPTSPPANSSSHRNRRREAANNPAFARAKP